jgi:hypothetical protein
MKQFLLLAIAATTAISTYASAPNFLWGKLIDSEKTQDLSAKVVFTEDGNAVSLSQFGSRESTDSISYNGEEIATGAATTSNSDNLNLLVIKHKISDGSRVWSVSSKNGDFYVSSYADMTATPDGGVVVLVSGRSSDVAEYTSPVLVDNSGAEVEFADWNTSIRIYNQVLIKINKEGNIVWARNIVMDQLPVPNATATGATDATTNGVTPNAVTVDADGNIYIGGNYRAPMIVTGEKNSTYVLTARNIESYTGDVQSAAGGTYVIRLDSEGNYINHLRVSGELTRDQANLFYVDGSSLYIAGSIKGTSGDKLTIAGKSVSVENEYDGIYVAKLATDLKSVDYVQYIKAFAVSNKQSTKLRDLKVINDNLYIVGGGAGGYAQAGASEAVVKSTGTTEEGWLIALSAENGSWVGAANNATNIGAYLNIFSYDNKLYVYGYRLNKETGTFLDEYSEGEFTYTNRYTIAKAGGVPTGYAAKFNESSKNFVALARGNAAFTFGDDTSSDAPTNWGGLITAYTFAETGSAASASIEAAKAIKVNGAQGQIEISAEEDTDVVISNAAGQVLSSMTVKPGATTFACTSGLYFVNNIKVVVK